MPNSKNNAEQTLPPNQRLAAPGKWPVVGERAPRPDDSAWTVTVCGLVNEVKTFSLEEIRGMGLEEFSVDIHCVTRWSKLGAKFTGIPLARLLSECGIQPGAKFISFVARSSHGHSTSLPYDDALPPDAYIAMGYEGEPIPTEHGGPIRIVTSGPYFYKSIKWLERIELLAEDRLGYWEAESGYHNGANPWREERYIASIVDPKRLQQLLDAMDVSGQELLSLQVAGRVLCGLDATDAKLRNADFSRCNLADANFANANLSNANFCAANLRGANFAGADLEGADFAGADLREANLSGASLFGSTFAPNLRDVGALLDGTSRFSSDSVAGLAPMQLEYLVSCGVGIGAGLSGRADLI